MESFSPDQGNEQNSDPLTFKVGEREFNAESAATKIAAADTHIAKVEGENATHLAQIAAMQSQLDQSTKLDEALAKLKAPSAGSQESQAAAPTSAVSEEQIREIATTAVSDHMSTQQAESQAVAAKKLADDTYIATGEALEAVYGDKTNEAMATTAERLGMTKDELYNMAKNPASASMLLDIMKVKAPIAQASPSGSFNTAALNQNQSEFLVDHSKPIISSTIIEALKKHGGSY